MLNGTVPADSSKTKKKYKSHDLVTDLPFVYKFHFLDLKHLNIYIKGSVQLLPHVETRNRRNKTKNNEGNDNSLEQLLLVSFTEGWQVWSVITSEQII